jgi:hypothetical protein
MTKWPPNNPWRLPSLVTKAILEESEELKIADRILVVLADIENYGKKVSCFETIEPSAALDRIKY